MFFQDHRESVFPLVLFSANDTGDSSGVHISPSQPHVSVEGQYLSPCYLIVIPFSPFHLPLFSRTAEGMVRQGWRPIGLESPETRVSGPEIQLEPGSAGVPPV